MKPPMKNIQPNTILKVLVKEESSGFFASARKFNPEQTSTGASMRNAVQHVGLDKDGKMSPIYLTVDKVL